MNWQEIMEQVLEINELQQELLLKSQNPIIKKITDRKEKYLEQNNFNIKSLNNAILEHQIMITPYQITILIKINNLSLNTDSQSIYINMPESQEEATKYVMDLKAKYELAIKCFDLVMDIETLSRTEYIFDYPFESSIYSQKKNLEDEIFLKCILEHKPINLKMFENPIVNKLKSFLTSLSTEEKKKLFLESLTLSYDRNVFNYLHKEKTILEICFKKKDNLRSFDRLGIIYNLYHQFLVKLENRTLLRMSLSDVYNEFKVIYDTPILKQKKK